MIPVWPYAFGGPAGSGIIRQSEDDFKVNELLGFEASGSGEHAFLQIQKRGQNTDYVARQLARFAGVQHRDVSYAGLKDRHAVTSQWFSVWLPGKADPDWQAFETEQITVLQATRHNKKLKRGVLQGNTFELLIRDWQGDSAKIQQLLTIVESSGMPNYFGAQRFGRAGANLAKAMQMFQGQRVKRQQRSLYLSAVRSFLFNQILSARVQQHNWDKALSGDTFMFDGSQQYFKSGQIDPEIQQRLMQRTIHPTGCLYGSGEDDLSAAALQLETSILNNHPKLTEGLLKASLTRARRPLRVNVEQLKWQVNADNVQLSFYLPAGSYATSVLREIIQIKEN